MFPQGNKRREFTLLYGILRIIQVTLSLKAVFFKIFVIENS